jgi:hypothetical protein
MGFQGAFQGDHEHPLNIDERRMTRALHAVYEHGILITLLVPCTRR